MWPNLRHRSPVPQTKCVTLTFCANEFLLARIHFLRSQSIFEIYLRHSGVGKPLSCSFKRPKAVARSQKFTEIEGNEPSQEELRLGCKMVVTLTHLVCVSGDRWHRWGHLVKLIQTFCFSKEYIYFAVLEKASRQICYRFSVMRVRRGSEREGAVNKTVTNLTGSFL